MRATAKLLLKAGVSIGLVCLLYSKLDWGDIGARMKGADPGWLALALALMFANTLASAAKWRIFLAADGLRQSHAALWASYITASFFNLFLPSTIGGDAYRVADIGSRTGEHARVAASILADRITGFFALSAYGCAAALFARGQVDEWRGWFPLPSAAALLALAGLAAALRSDRLFAAALWVVPFRRLRERASALAMKISGAMRRYAGRTAPLAAAVAISFLFQLNLILAVWAISRAVGLSIPLAPFFLFLPIKTFLEMIPVSVFGIGLRDLGYTIFMTAMGHGAAAPADAALISAAEVVLTVIYSSLGGLVFVCGRGGRRGAE